MTDQNEIGAGIAEMLENAPVTEEEVETSEEAVDEELQDEEEETVSEEAEETKDETAEEDEKDSSAEETSAVEGEDEEEEGSTEIADLRSKNELLNARLDRLEAKSEASIAAEEDEDALPELEPENFLTDEEFDSAISDRESLNTVLNKVAKKAATAATEHILRRIPSLVSREASNTIAFQNMVNEFYQRNKDLLPQRQLVGAIFQEHISQNPETAYDELLNGPVAAEVRKRLKLKAPIKRHGTKPKSFAKPGGSRKVTPNKPSGLNEEIKAMENIR